MRGNAFRDAPRHQCAGLSLTSRAGRGASPAAFPRRVWERSGWVYPQTTGRALARLASF
ncbi:DUF1534 domain-containing protein [Pseudomonas sp. ANT_H12B]|nr:DUF1534 domain-containing protein [Pseudomonas sp. ANT_H12B]